MREDGERGKKTQEADIQSAIAGPKKQEKKEVKLHLHEIVAGVWLDDDDDAADGLDSLATLTLGKRRPGLPAKGEGDERSLIVLSSGLWVLKEGTRSDLKYRSRGPRSTFLWMALLDLWENYGVCLCVFVY